MMDAPRITLRALVGPAEAPAIEQAALGLSRALAAQGTPAVGVELVASPGQLRAGTKPVVAIASLSPEVEAAMQDWPSTEARLRSDYEALARQDAQTLFLCTVLRHAPPELGEAARIPVRLAIRRLDLLAVQLSHATGLNIIDVDRALADIGAQRLKTDYRLGGAAAAEAAGRVICAALLAAGVGEADWAEAAAIGAA